MHSIRTSVFALVACLAAMAAVAADDAGVEQFHFVLEAELPGDVSFAYALVTGDVSGWWDHTFSENPLRLYVDARPGGGFYEIFDEAGNGVEHARVIFARPGEKLTLAGPLGFSGWATEIVFTYEFETIETGSLLRLTVNGSGQMNEGWADSVEAVWRHFIFEQLVPYAQGRCEQENCR
ncbi:MAG: hypothetical protein OET16_01420 [Chromatiales bacterium]|jgi:hypothetical protein|nr:hypothetical protein [Chromatiales bacterium]PLX55891.1 MAG: hypothetical protein C0629_10290 [Chromatiales bacterium]